MRKHNGQKNRKLFFKKKVIKSQPLKDERIIGKETSLVKSRISFMGCGFGRQEKKIDARTGKKKKDKKKNDNAITHLLGQS